MNRAERVKMVKAMEFIARNVNNEDLFYGIWLPNGVADEDIRYGDLSTDGEEADWYTEDNNFSELMGVFLYLMKETFKSGGLYCDGITSEE